MLFHRAETFNHIVATTSLGGVGNKNEEMVRMFISDAIELTRTFGHLDDSDRSSIATMSEFDSGNHDNSILLHVILANMSFLLSYPEEG